ncbi:MAG: extracellular solute-binding protein [Clostridia bacterium]|nr:extracellular solute-binding protein [Clostridia bacterium]
MRYLTKSASLLLLASILASASACGGTASGGGDTTAPADTTPAETAPAYKFADVNLGGGEFHIVNTSTTWNFYNTIYFEEATGDTLDDAVYAANVKVEEAFNCKLTVTDFDINKIVGEMTKVILAGDDVYQAALTAANRTAPLLTEGYVQDLSGLDNIHLDEPWWDQNISAFSSLGGSSKVYFGISDINLMNFEVLMGVYVNDDMLADLGLPTLYDTVRAGKWTLAEFHKHLKAAANLNGDENFTYSNTGKATYGMTYWDTAVHAIIFGMGNNYVSIGKDGMPSLALDNEKFYSTAEKVAALFAIPGEAVYLNSSTDRMHYEDSFEDGRALFTVAQLKGSSKFRDMEDTYGILPLPKYDEAQKDYIGYCSANVVATTIPMTNSEPETAAAIMDAMSYLAHTEILPIYYGVNVEQKQMRNKDSIEMLQIMGANRTLDVGLIYSWTSDMNTAVYKQLATGDGAVASIIASHKESIQGKFDTTLKAFE